MGNEVSEPLTNQRSPLSEFEGIPMEIQVHICSFVPRKEFSTLLLISKALHQQILRSDEIFANYYSDFREHALEELKRLNGSLISGVPVHVPMELYECDDGMMPLNIEKVETKLHSKCSKNYQRLQQAVKDHNQTIESIERFSGHQRRQIRSNSNCRIC
ncbi:Hypothetical protein NAEGRDRAFT_54355 [Naegleria gruberi]|uniref:F-box domain-containing protein n=1 Tax=Naegleria gruberi TaxID=5762 RepID=D2W369_NAEGR|nr:uncharacterized protein NAEGRDRAFT_54355 [Naegleria gruberi]EFC36435.1 Hypothetical protein NAEGRDRAFT_54355 [Naegleria gruberi]|eukprot:XP_002669179.1 Hypothetical protein NAEGRDRAFT_54355 [Naegleria gruberi strain NEG-M]